MWFLYKWSDGDLACPQSATPEEFFDPNNSKLDLKDEKIYDQEKIAIQQIKIFTAEFFFKVTFGCNAFKPALISYRVIKDNFKHNVFRNFYFKAIFGHFGEISSARALVEFLEF